jgi:Uma2 family endonuclease
VSEAMATRIYSAEDLLGMDGDYELDSGTLVPVSPGSPRHGELIVEVGAVLRDFVKRNDLGKVFSDAGFQLESNPDTVRGPDVAFVRAARTHDMPERGFLKTSPDLAVEILSPGDSLRNVHTKIGQYLQAGTSVVWLVNFVKRQVAVFQADSEVRVLGVDDVLDGGDVLPGFTWSVGDIFLEGPA